MSIWVAVVFFCANSECAFWKADEVFNNKAQCEESLYKAMDSLERNGVEAAGACMSIKMTRT